MNGRLNPVMNKANMILKRNRWMVNKKAAQNKLEWPVAAPFSAPTSPNNLNKPVAHIVLDEQNLEQAKDIVKAVNALPGFFARRLSTIPANRPNFEKCRVIVRNLPFGVGVWGRCEG